MYCTRYPLDERHKWMLTSLSKHQNERSCSLWFSLWSWKVMLLLGVNRTISRKQLLGMNISQPRLQLDNLGIIKCLYRHQCNRFWMCMWSCSCILDRMFWYPYLFVWLFEDLLTLWSCLWWGFRRTCQNECRWWWGSPCPWFVRRWGRVCSCLDSKRL